MATLAQWVQGARPRTFPAAISPVLVGTGSAYAMGRGNPAYAVLALVVSLALQVGVNYANDYSDGIRGTDADRVGPARLVGGRMATAANVRLAALLAFGLAALVGLVLVALSSTWWLLVAGAASIVAAWYYTGGRRPYGYAGFGEAFVFVFFGLVAVLGTTYTQAHALDVASWSGAVGIGALACALLVANNLRDIPGDRLAGKRTLAVRMGATRTRSFYTALILLAMLEVVVCATVHPRAIVGIASAVPAAVPVRIVLRGAQGADLLPVLGATGLLEIGYAVLLGLGLLLSR